jgi:hypothetical protein
MKAQIDSQEHGMENMAVDLCTLFLTVKFEDELVDKLVIFVVNCKVPLFLEYS